MGTPLRHIVSDISSDLKQTYDDLEITDAQVAYWTILIGNRLLSQHIEKRSSGAFLTTFAEVPVLSSDVTGPNLVRYRKYFDLPDSIFDFDGDEGIAYITYSVDPELPSDLPPITQVGFYRTTPGAVATLYMNPYTSPTEQRPFFYRSSGRVYLLGVECVNIESVELGLYLTIPPVTKIDLDADFPFPEELIAILKRQVLDLGRFALLIPQERINDGDSSVPVNQVPTNKLVSVNELNPEQS